MGYKQGCSYVCVCATSNSMAESMMKNSQINDFMSVVKTMRFYLTKKNVSMSPPLPTKKRI